MAYFEVETSERGFVRAWEVGVNLVTGSDVKLTKTYRKADNRKLALINREPTRTLPVEGLKEGRLIVYIPDEVLMRRDNQ